MDAFHRLAPFLQEYIFEQGWTGLRDVQIAACRTIFDTDHHLLLSSGTASGKTEAAFLPAITLLCEQPASSVGILYISPLKALINDQFERLTDILKRSHLPVTRWHGDASPAKKHALEQDPKGVLQITPESLESLVMRKPEAAAAMFADTRFIIIDEVHAFMSSPRGAQLLCLLTRISRLTGVCPRRIGLSATLSSPEAAARWLALGTQNVCDAPVCGGEKKRIRVRMDVFPRIEKRQLYREVYAATLGKRAILFANSRGETEEAAACLKEEAEARFTPDVYRVHHGSLSAALRQDTEREMKQAEGGFVTCATLTLELGIDIGKLDTVVQLGAPFTVSSLVQRLGRCGRRGQAAELLFLIREDEGDVPWDLIKGIAILELYRKEKWTEPGRMARMDMSLLFHQTLSVLYAGGEMRASYLAQQVLTLPPFAEIEREDYAILLRDMIERDFIQRTERGGLIVGSEGERLCNHCDFFSVFEAREETEVRCGDELLGSVTGNFKPGDGLRLGGRCYRVIEVTDGKVFVENADHAQVMGWTSAVEGSLHAKVAEKMREVLFSDEDYPYMTPRCRQRLREARRMAARFASGMVEGGGRVWLYPWLDSRTLQMLALMLPRYGLEAEILPSRVNPVYLEVTCGDTETLRNAFAQILSGDDKPEFPETFDFPGKYAEYVPRELLEKAYITDGLGSDE